MTQQYRDAERLDLTSASSFEADVFCPGRRNLINSLPPEALVQLPDPDADRGTRIHKARETGNPIDLEDEDFEIYKNGRETENRILAQWCLDFGLNETEVKVGTPELRLYLHDPDTLKPLHSCKIDVHYVCGNRLLIVEWKTLYCTNLTAAERNWQGRSQAVLVRKEYDAEHVRVAFNKAMFGKMDVVDYNAADLAHAERSMLYHLWETRQPEAQRRAGVHCRYCPGKPFCRESAAWALLPSTTSTDPSALTKEDITEMVALMPPKDLALMFTRSTVIGKILEAGKERLKTMTPKQLAELGLGRGKGRTLEYIERTKDLFEKLKAEGISEGEIWLALSFGKTELIKALQRDRGISKDKATGWVKQFVDEFGSRTTSDAPVIVL